MIIDCEIFYFSYGGRPWMIELWKGQYGLETGAEIGVYRDDVGRPDPSIDPKSRFYNTCVPLNMNFTLKRNGAQLLHRGPESHWWLTGFKWGVFTEKTSDLTMELEIECLNPAMRDAFNQAVMNRGYHDSKKGHRRVAFTFHRPKTVQPESRTRLESRMQTDNQRLVAGYNLYKISQNISTNDPNAITQPDEEAQKAIQVISSAATKAQYNASAVAKKFQSKALPIAKKVQTKASTAAKTLQSKAAAAVDKIQNLPDEARIAYDEIFTFFDKKVWHVTR
jgi:hypothetical protein